MEQQSEQERKKVETFFLLISQPASFPHFRLSTVGNPHLNFSKIGNLVKKRNGRLIIPTKTGMKRKPRNF